MRAQYLKYGRIWSILLIKSELKGVYILVEVCLYFNYLVSVAAGGPASSKSLTHCLQMLIDAGHFTLRDIIKVLPLVTWPFNSDMLTGQQFLFLYLYRIIFIEIIRKKVQ